MGHGSGVTEVARANTLGSTGYTEGQTYDFQLLFTESLIQVMVDGILELNVTAAGLGLGAFSDGAFGFYHYSQANVLYAGITEDDDVIPNVPEPEMFALFILGLAGLTLRKKAL